MANQDRNIVKDATQPPEQHVQHTSPQDGRQSGGALELNHASEEEIADIAMIGKKLAHVIVQARSQRGGFRTWEELREVAGLDPMKIAELQRAARLGD